jgi:sugar phosphate isomerase/epimerase
MRFALSTHLFHNERLDAAHLEAIAAQGFTDVELFATRSHFDYHDRGRVHEVRSWLERHGLAAGSLHGPICESFRDGVWGRSYSNASTDSVRRQEAVDEARVALEAARILGCGYMVVHLGLPAGQPGTAGDNDRRAAQKSLEQLAAAAGDAGIRLAVEVIPNALSTPDALGDLLDAEDAFDLATTGVCLDLGHAHLMGGVVDATETLAGAVIATHLHDNNGREDRHLVPGQGSIDWPMALTALWKIDYRGPLVFEVADHGDVSGILQRIVGARARLQAILDDRAAPMPYAENP